MTPWLSQEKDKMKISLDSLFARENSIKQSNCDEISQAPTNKFVLNSFIVSEGNTAVAVHCQRGSWGAKL
jgi:hypothetical protein